MKNRYSAGYIELSMRQFAKNKLAVGGVIFVLLLFFIAVYAPLLANNKPLLLYSPLPDHYEDNLYTLISNIEVYAQQTDDSDKNIRHKNYIDRSFLQLKQHLRDQDLERFIVYENQVKSLIQKNNLQDLNKLTGKIENNFLPKNINLKYVLKFPAIKSLTTVQIFFICFYPLFLILVILKNIFRNKKNRVSLKKETVICLIISLFCCVLWHFCNPTVFDPTDYKQLTKDLPANARVIFAPIPFGENENIISEASNKPTWLITKNRRTERYHILGTDTNGRDVLCRMIWGTRVSMSVGFIAVGICLAIGIFLGSIAGYFRGWVDIAISRIIEIVICFPVFFLILTVLAFLRPSIINIMVVIGVTGWTGIARLCRGEFLKLSKQDFVTAANALGASNLKIIFKHILPNGLGPILVSISFGIAGAILTESALSFLGFGVPQPTASWGDLLNNGRNNIQETWWLTLFPGMAIFMTVTAFNLAGEGLRDALDPRLRQQ